MAPWLADDTSVGLGLLRKPNMHLLASPPATANIATNVISCHGGKLNTESGRYTNLCLISIFLLLIQR